MKSKILGLLAAALCSLPGSAIAGAINIFFDATDAAYTLGGAARTGDFTVQFSSDTTLVLSNANNRTYASLAPSISLGGIGTATATSSSYFAFINRDLQVAGFGVDGPGDRWDLNLPGVGVGTYDFISEFGPFSTTSFFLTGNIFLATNLGDMIVNSIRQGTFRVEVGTTVPEPGTLALLGIGLVGLGLSRRKKAA